MKPFPYANLTTFYFDNSCRKEILNVAGAFQCDHNPRVQEMVVWQKLAEVRMNTLSEIRRLTFALHRKSNIRQAPNRSSVS